MSEEDEERRGSSVNLARFDALLTNYEGARDLYRSVRSEVVRNLQELGITPRRRPNMERPRLRGPVSQMSDAELGDIQGEFSVWEDFIGEQLALHETQAQAMEAESKHLMSRLKDEAGGPVAGRADKAQGDPRYVRAHQEFLVQKGTARSLQQALEGLTNQRKVVSRYIEIRTREIDGVRRTHNVQNMRKGRGAPEFRDSDPPEFRDRRERGR